MLTAIIIDLRGEQLRNVTTPHNPGAILHSVPSSITLEKTTPIPMFTLRLSGGSPPARHIFSESSTSTVPVKAAEVECLKELCNKKDPSFAMEERRFHEINTPSYGRDEYAGTEYAHWGSSRLEGERRIRGMRGR